LVYITHDIDWLNPLHPYSVIKTFTHGKKWIQPSHLFSPKLFLQGIERLLQFNQNQHTKSIWLIGATNQHTFHRKGLRYHSTGSSYAPAMSLLKTTEVEIGLHSVSSAPIVEQCNRLSNILDKQIKYHRSHFLNFNPDTLYQELQHAEIKVDFSTGTSRAITLPQQIQNTANVSAVPTILFDNVFFFQSPDEVFNQLKKTLLEAQAQQRDVAILFHPENFIINPALWEYYQDVLKMVRES
jgi:hypothetical protein